MVSRNAAIVIAVAARNTLREGDDYVQQSVTRGSDSPDHTCFAVAVAWAKNPRLDAVDMRDMYDGKVCCSDDPSS